MKKSKKGESESIDSLFVVKRFGTYTDTFLMLGLARLMENALRYIKHHVDRRQKTTLTLVDRGTDYCIQFSQPVELERLLQVPLSNPLLPVAGRKTDRSQFSSTTEVFDTVKRTEERKLYRDSRFLGKKAFGEDLPPPPNPKTQNGVALVSMRHDRNHNKLFEEAEALFSPRSQNQTNYGELLVALGRAFSQPVYSSYNGDVEKAASLFKKATGIKLPASASAVKIYLPTCVQGVNRVKSDNNKTDPQKTNWLLLWLVAIGFFWYAVAERIKISDRVYDWRVLALQPSKITFENYQAVLDNLRRYNPASGGHGAARFDAELILRFYQELLKLSHRDKHILGGFTGTHFGQKGQVYGVKELVSLGLPNWIEIDSLTDASQVREYYQVLNEHLAIVRGLSVESGHGEMLANYRSFLSSSDWHSFFRFQTSYAEYSIRCLAQGHSPTRFFVSTLDVMTHSMAKLHKESSPPSLSEILEHESFKRIAKAINQATVYAGEVRTKSGWQKLEWDRTYGLAQKLSGQASSKEKFLSELFQFLTTYESENLRLREKLKKDGKQLKRLWPRQEDLEKIVEFFEKYPNPSLLANLLVAYGYANWSKLKSEIPLTEEDVVEEESDRDLQSETVGGQESE